MSGSEQVKKSGNRKFTDFIMKFSEYMGSFAALPSVSAIQDGLVSTTPVIVIGSLFLIFSLLGQPLGTSKTALIPFLSSVSVSLANVNSMTLGFIGLYCSFTIAHSYGEKLGLDPKNAGLTGLVAFLFICLTGPTKDNAISIQYFGASGIFVAMITSLISIRIYKLFVERNIVIKLPSSVPPSVGGAFLSLIPMGITVFLAWLIRSLLNFDLAGFLSTAFTHILTAADSLGVFMLVAFIIMVLWSVGLNGPSMLLGVVAPILMADLASNSAALVSGKPLEHIWTMTFMFSFIWMGNVYPILVMAIKSKLKSFKAVGIASAPAAMFNIIEPVTFGLPIATNGFLMLPFIISGTLGCFIAYFSAQIGFISKPFVDVPWATPPFISGFLSTGDWKVLIVQAAIFVIGYLINRPFFKAFEKNELEKESISNSVDPE